MDHFRDEILAGRMVEGFGGLASGLYWQRSRRSFADWRSYVATTVLSHPVRELVHRDPFTLRSFSKPSGYAGDAVMLDMIYRREYDGASNDPIVRGMFNFGISRPAPCAVRNRRQRLAKLIDETVRRRSDARILALAAGHLREIELSQTVGPGFRGEIVALDQDAESLAVVERDYADRGVRVVHAPIKHLLAGRLDLRGFDLVYAAGLLDYLPTPTAKALCRQMFHMLNPGGRMLVANFVPGIPDVGYMESFMDWHLIYRGEEEMLDLANGIDGQDLRGFDVSSDGTGNIAFLSAQRR